MKSIKCDFSEWEDYLFAIMNGWYVRLFHNIREETNQLSFEINLKATGAEKR